MQITTTIPATRAALAGTSSLALVPTMGALHAGHRSLIDRARAENHTVAVSIFVNPLQFAPTEDLDRYPRTLEADIAMCEQAGVDLLFTPTPQEMYPQGREATFTIDPGPLGTRLDGASRPGHFTGVATVVAKLFNIVQPARAYFGQKDAAQLAVLRQLVRDLDIPVEIVACPIVRDPDGLALSSRNRFLSAAERSNALALIRTLRSIESRIQQGTRETAALLATPTTALDSSPTLTLDYLTIVSSDTLLPVPIAASGALIAIAAKVGTTRLIDNLLAP